MGDELGGGHHRFGFGDVGGEPVDEPAVAVELGPGQCAIAREVDPDAVDAVGKLLFNVLAMVVEFEADLIRVRTREGMAVAKAKGRLRGKQPKLSKKQEAHLVSVHRAGTHTTVELAELVAVAFNRLPRHQTRRRRRINA